MSQVLLGWSATEEELSRVRSALPPATEVVAVEPTPGLSRYGATAEAMLAAGKDADAVLTWVLPEDFVRSASHLRFVAWMHHGFDRLPADLLLAHQIDVANLSRRHGVLDSAVAEQTWALLLGLAKRVVVKHNAVRAARWGAHWDASYSSAELAGKTLAVVGFGGIGSRVARIAAAFDMRVVAVRSDPTRDTPGVARCYGPDQLLEAVAESDYIVLATPLTPQTHRFIDADVLSHTKPGAFIVNVGRADLVNEAAIYVALTDGDLGGFASDVWWDYVDEHPPGQHFSVPSRLGVHLLDNVIGSGDQSANTLEVKSRAIEAGLVNINAFLNGTAEEYVLDLRRGY